MNTQHRKASELIPGDRIIIGASVSVRVASVSVRVKPGPVEYIVEYDEPEVELSGAMIYSEYTPALVAL